MEINFSDVGFEIESYNFIGYKSFMMIFQDDFRHNSLCKSLLGLYWPISGESVAAMT